MTRQDEIRDQRLLATPLGPDGAPLAACPAWHKEVSQAAEPLVAAAALWERAASLPLLGQRREIDGVALVEVSFLAWLEHPGETLVHVNSLTDNLRLAFEPWLMQPVAGTALHSVDVWLPADGCYSYRLVSAARLPRDAGSTREGWRQMHENGEPDPRNPELIVNPLGRLSSVWRGPDAPPPRQGTHPEWEHIEVPCSGEDRLVALRRGAGGHHLPALVLFDGQQWCAQGVADRLGTPELACYDVIAIDSLSVEQRWRDLTSLSWAGQLRHILEVVAQRWGRSLTPAELVLAGQSLGGLAAARLSLGPDRLADRAVCQSASYWWRAGAGKQIGQQGVIFDELARLNAHGTRLVVQVGSDEGEMVARAREFTTAARAAGAWVRHREWRGGHDYAWWRDALAAGLAELRCSANG